MRVDRERHSARLVSARRGSVLVLVVGVLALITIIAVVYVTLSRGDRRSSTTLARSADVDEAVTKVRDYIAGIIADDVLSTTVQGVGPGNRPILVREAFDYPNTDWLARSVAAPGAGFTVFDPRGSYDTAWTGSGRDPRSASDPWLASTEPTFLGAVAGFPDFSASGNPAGAQSRFLNNRDWLQISNLAPDGRFVNLVNLRGDFEEEPGADGMSEDLSLINGLTNAGRPTGFITAGQQLDFGNGGSVTLNIDAPAHWTMRQRGAVRPMRDDLPPGDPNHINNQWADADGDGLADSRWFELVDASQFTSSPAVIRRLLPGDGRFRYFIAARVEDLSGRVNVNTAAALALGPSGGLDPTSRFPAGLSPSDVDLRRLLGLGDSFVLYGLQQGGYRAIPQPLPLAAADPANYSNMDFARAFAMGTNGYTALRIAIDSGSVLPENVIPGLQWQRTAQERFDYFRLLGDQPSGSAFNSGSSQQDVGGVFGLSDMLDLLVYRGVNDPTRTTQLERTVGGRLRQSANRGGPDSRFSPLRENRPLEVERAVDVNNDFVVDDAYFLKRAVDVRQAITTISGSRPILSALLAPTATAAAEIDRNRELQLSLTQAVRLAAVPDTTATLDFLFVGLADGLLPYSGQQFGTRRPWQAPELATLAYGGNHEIALRAAAHKTVNLATSFTERAGRRTKPRGYTLKIDSAYTPVFPYFTDPVRQLELPSDRLADTGQGDLVTSRAVNVFGVEPQPFLTQVASFAMYTDAPRAAGGDQDWDPNPSNPPPPITIDGTIDAANPSANPDFLALMLSFQVVNPFTEPVDLFLPTPGGGASQYSQFYFEFGGNFYRLQPPSAGGGPGGGLGPTQIAAGGRAMFYVLSQSPEDIAQRWNDATGTSTYSAASVNTWINRQLAAAAPPNRPTNAQVIVLPLVRFDPQNDTVNTAFNPIFVGRPQSPQASGVANRDARMWRYIFSTDSRDTSPSVNSRLNDQLVDRLRDPARPSGALNERATLDRRLPFTNQDIGGTEGGDEAANPLDNTGFSITLYGYIRRPDDPQGVPPRGAVPAFAIEPRFSAGRFNLRDDDQRSLNGLSQSDFSAYPGGNDRLETMITTLSAAGGELDNDIFRDPTETPPVNSIEGDLSTPQRPFDTIYTEWMIRDQTIGAGTGQVRELRLADVLATLAVGPVQDPLADNDPATLDPEREWITLSEALALALNYDSDPNSTSLFFRAGDPVDGYLDRGALRLDRFAPFIDENADGVYDSTNDVPVTPGIPLALNIINQFRPGDAARGDEKTPSAGRVNINTMTPQVARVLPLIRPTSDPGGTATDWWWTGANAHSRVSDISAAIIAYRDKIAASTMPPIVGGATVEVSYRDTITNPAQPLNADGRLQMLTDTSNPTVVVTAIRETPGFASVGELGAVIQRNITRDERREPRYRRFIDYLGYDGGDDATPGNNNSRLGIDPVTYTDPASAGTRLTDQVANEPDEKLAVLNSVLGSVTVSSDVYAVWFIVHGYQRSDTVGADGGALDINEPMIPSIARRYVMVLDRSNVTRRGEKPRVLLFEQVPY